MRRSRGVVVLTALSAALAGAPAAAAQEAPRRVAVAGGVYSGPASVNGLRCAGRCKVTIVMTSDGLEITPESYATLHGRCYDGPLDFIPIRSDGRFEGDADFQQGSRTITGRVVDRGRRIVGKGSALCDRDRGFRFSARLVRRRKPPAADAVQSCTRIPTADFKQRYLALARGLGCGRAHDTARQLHRLAACSSLRRAAPSSTCRASGLTCAAPSSPEGLLDPAAQVRCAAGERIVDLVRLASCGGAGQDTDVFAVALVGCAAAKRLGNAWEDACSPAADEPRSPCDLDGFRCVDLPEAADEEDTYQRCTDTADPRRVAEFLHATSDVV